MFTLSSNKRFPLNITGDENCMLPFYRWEHRGTILWHLREFMVYIDYLPKVAKCYIEELTGGNLIKIEDDSLWAALGKFAEENGLLDVTPPPPRRID